MDATYFTGPEEFRAWLDVHHDSESELLVGFFKRSTGKPSITWAEAVDEALCYGWIDGKGKRVDDERHTIRFTPRRLGSIWSDRNIKRVQALIADGRMRPAGIRAFEARSEEKSRVYSFEQGEVSFAPDQLEQLQTNATAWDFFQSQAPSYQRAAAWWVISAKQATTRERRLAQLIEDSAAGRTVKPLTRPDRSS